MLPAYFDHNATTPLDERVLQAMLPFFRERFGNASSRHEYGRSARKAVDDAREQVADMVGAHPSQVVFVSGGTEANNLLIKGAAARMPAFADRGERGGAPQRDQAGAGTARAGLEGKEAGG